MDKGVLGVVVPGTPSRLFALSDAVSSQQRAQLVSGPLPGVLAPVVAEQKVAEVIAKEVAVAEGGLPDWFLALLPDTKIALGLDLQGGIDLTLQVGLEDAVEAQVTRDAGLVSEQAAKEGVIVESARRERGTAVMWITTDAALGDLSKFMQQYHGVYVYSESDGNRHAFEMQQFRQDEVASTAVESVLETLRKRIDATGTKEPSIVKKGGGRINVQLPGMVDLDSAVAAIGTTAVLEFRLLDEEFDDSVLDQILTAAEEAMPPEQFENDELLNDWLWNTKRLDDDRLVLWEYEETVDGEERVIPLPLKNEIVLTGNDLSNAGVGRDPTTQTAYVSMDFKPRGAKIFCDVTSENVGKRFAIILDGVVKSAPNIRERICGGAASIEMGNAVDPMGEAQTLALVLRTGSLDAPVVIAQVRSVGPSLGADSIRKGRTATIFGLGVVLVFMVGWYRTAGVMADIALTVNLLLVLALLALFGATLTLPGIAGIALTIGMAVDANIIIYERIREELKLGALPRKAVDTGFEKAMVAVLDANITTGIAGIVLFSYGTGPIKGFAVTLLIGIITTLVTALFVTRTLMGLLTRSSTARLKI
jgi:preprotein translocase subunit SecD